MSDAHGHLLRNARRVGEIAAVLAKYGLADRLRWLDVDWIQGHLRSADGQRLGEQSHEARIRLALVELGTTFIKLGQVLSTRPDLVGHVLADELSLLQADTTPDPPEVARATLLAELGRPPEEVFAAFEEQAFASASIAQVHRATLPGGEAVALKLMRHGVREQVDSDLEILQAVARLAEKHLASLRPYQPVRLAHQFEQTLRRELDFTHERRNMEQFRAAFADDPTVHFPCVYPQWCTARLLTMELLDGVSLADADGLRASGVDLARFARHGANLYLEMVFRDASYHADPHPGNLLLLPDGVLGVLDCGMVGRIDETLRQDIEAMLFAAVENDARELAQVVLRLGAAPADIDRAALQTEIAEYLGDYMHHSLAQVEVGAAVRNLIDLIRRYQVVLPASLALLLRTIVVLEGTSRALDRDFSLAELIKPYYRRALRRRFSPRAIWHRVRRSGRHWERLLESLPEDLRQVLDRCRDGTFRVQFEHQNLRPSVDRLTTGILAAALIVGSSALWTNAAPPRIGGVSLLGVVGYLLAVMLGVRLWRSARRAPDPGNQGGSR
jgi:ubiquinone biosynthesis protein